MIRTLLLSLALMLATPMAQAADILEWLESKTVKASNLGSSTKPADSAALITLEEKQSEMYPHLSIDGKALLVLSQTRKQSWISRHHAENGDPLNLVSNDARALDSMNWKENGDVYYLSERAGGLGLWEKIADGEGMQRRVMRLGGALTQPILLKDESVIAVRLSQITDQHGNRIRQSPKRDDFINWEFAGFKSEIVRFYKDGSAKVLADGINPALSPDGNSIVFAMSAGRSMHLFRINIDGNELIQMTDARSIDAQPTWSRDGKWIIFTSNRAEADLRHKGKSQWDIWAIGADGRNLTQITFDEARDGAPSVGADGSIYFHSDREVSKAEKQARQVKSVARHGFHIWRIAMPATAKQ